MGFEHTGKQLNFFGIADANIERIAKQNSKPIMVVIGNPPYNANQLNENENNKNREYPEIDRRIKETYIKHSKAQKTKLYDMYARFLRWASDRLDKDGVIAFVSNSSFLNARSYDGFRKVVANEFNEIYIIDLKGDARTSGEQRRKEGGNIFSDQIRVGVAIYFLVRKKGTKGCHIHYNAISDYVGAEEKKAYLRDNKIINLKFQPIRPDKNNNWLDIADDQWDELIPIASKAGKSQKGTTEPKTIFKLFSTGISTNRDEWIVDIDKNALKSRMMFFAEFYTKELLSKSHDFNPTIKWSRNLKQRFERKLNEPFEPKRIEKLNYRPFCPFYFYNSDVFIDEDGLSEQIFDAGENLVISISGVGSSKKFSALATKFNFSLDLLEKTQGLPLYRYAESGGRTENITDWALGQFQKKYKDRKITKEDIFHYVYAVLHHPAYRAKYEINLKREFPRIPFYEGFWKWAEWGKKLMELHLGYETIKPFPLERLQVETLERSNIQTKLMARKERGKIEIDTATVRAGPGRVR